MGIVQLRRSIDFVRIRTERVARYDAAFGHLPLILPPRPAEGDDHSWHLYIIQLGDNAPIDRDEFISTLRRAGVGTSVHYRPLHQMTYWKGFCEGQSFPEADRVFNSCVSLPLFMAMTDAEQNRVIDVVRSVLAGA
jgi:dTDP-4-amino-4,6-dideoxygalactose transaminase